MLQIYLFGDKEQGFLDIDSNTVLDMESTDNMWDEELLDGEFSLPFDLPWTGNNRRLMGFAERLENFSTAPRSWRVIVYDSGFPEIPSGKLTLLEKSGAFSYQRGKFSTTISGTKGLFGTLIKGKKLSSLSLGGPITWSGMDSRQWATQHMTSAGSSTPYYAFAPVAIEDFFDTDRPDYDNEFIALNTVNCVVQAANGSWQFGRPKSTNQQEAAAPLTAEYNDYRTVPFFQLNYVLRKVFEEAGFAVSGDFFSAGNFEKAYIFNQCAIEYYSTSFTDFTRKIIPGDHMPDMLISEFLKAVFSFFCMYPVFTGAAEVVLLYRVRQLRSRRVAPMNSVCSSQFTATYADAATENGYTLKYSWGEDNYYSERLKDRSQKIVVGTVATLAQLYTLVPGQPLNTDCIAFVEAENMWYQVADATTSPVKWDAWAEGLEDYVNGSGEGEVDTGISPLATYVEFVASAGLYSRHNKVGTRQRGTYNNNKYQKVTNAITGLRLFYIDNSGAPYTHCHNRDGANNKLVPYSLAWAGADGMAANFHAAWQAVKENMQVVKTDYIANQKVLADIAAANCHEIGGVLFLPQMVERTIPLGKTMTVSLVPL